MDEFQWDDDLGKLFAGIQKNLAFLLGGGAELVELTSIIEEALIVKKIDIQVTDDLLRAISRLSRIIRDKVDRSHELGYNDLEFYCPDPSCKIRQVRKGNNRYVE